jgi:hypothetical protein
VSPALLTVEGDYADWRGAQSDLGNDALVPAISRKRYIAYSCHGWTEPEKHYAQLREQVLAHNLRSFDVVVGQTIIPFICSVVYEFVKVQQFAVGLVADGEVTSSSTLLNQCIGFDP